MRFSRYPHISLRQTMHSDRAISVWSFHLMRRQCYYQRFY